MTAHSDATAPTASDNGPGDVEATIHAHGIVHEEPGPAGLGYLIHQHTETEKSGVITQSTPITTGLVTARPAALLSIQHALEAALNLGIDSVAVYTPSDAAADAITDAGEETPATGDDAYVATVQDLLAQFDTATVSKVPESMTRARTLAENAIDPED